MITTSSNMTENAPQQSAFLRLPPELRNCIYEYAVFDDVEQFAVSSRKPALLSVCQVTQHEYASLFYATDLIQLDAYYKDTKSFSKITGKKAKQSTLEQSRFTQLLGCWTVASARQYCRQTSPEGEEDRQRGIVAVITNAGFKQWQWSAKL